MRRISWMDNQCPQNRVPVKPDLTIDTPFNVWMDIITRKADGQKMFMEQKYKVQGDLTLMMKLFSKE